MTSFTYISRNTAIFLALVALALSTANAETGGKNEIGLLLGVTATPARKLADGATVAFGSGAVFQATYARQLTQSHTAALFLELPFVASPLVALSSPNVAVPANYAYLFVTPGVRVKLKPDSPVSPWISLGGGYGYFEESKQRQGGSPISQINAGRGTLQFGGGIDFRTPVRFLLPIGFRAEVRDFYSGKPDFRTDATGRLQHNLVFSGGLVIRF
jgi:hypothetical protein